MRISRLPHAIHTRIRFDCCRRSVLSAIFLVLMVLCGPMVCAQETVTVVDSGFAVFSSDLTRGEARTRALEDFFRNAVVHATGIKIEDNLYISKEERQGRYLETVAQVTRTNSSGRISEYRIVDEGFVKARFAGGFVEAFRIVGECNVALEHETPDPAFLLSLRLNQDVYYVHDQPQQSDELIASVVCSRKAYLTLFGVSGDSVTVLFPNQRESRNELQPETRLEIPTQESRINAYLHFRPTLAVDENRAVESIVAIATREPVPFVEKRGAGLSPYRSKIGDLLRWIASIRPSQRVEARRTYEIRRAAQ